MPGIRILLVLAFLVFIGPIVAQAGTQGYGFDAGKTAQAGQQTLGSTGSASGQGIEVKEIGFNWGAGSSAIALKERLSEEDVPFPTPEYVKNGRNKPAAYVRNAAVTVQARFEAKNPLNQVTIWAEGGLGGLTKQLVDFGGTTSSPSIIFTALRRLPGRIGSTRVAWRWKYRDASGATGDVGQTTHDLYSTYAQPLKTPVYRELLEWTTDWARNAGSEKAITDAIIRKLWKSGLQYGKAAWKTGDMLDIGGGMCGGFSAMFAEMTGIHGVSAPNSCFILRDDGAASPEVKWLNIVIKAPGLNRSEPPVDLADWRDINGRLAYPDPIYLGNSSSHDDVHLVTEKRWYFSSPYDGHCINFLEYKGKVYLYDPSFGKGPYNNTFTSIPTGSTSGTALNAFRQNYHDRAIDYMEGIIAYRDCPSCTPQVDENLSLTVRTRNIPALRDPTNPETFEIHYFWD